MARSGKREDAKGEAVAGKQMVSGFQRPTADEYHSWYNLSIWRGPAGLREQQLVTQPLCERCLLAARATPATVVNHRKPHRGNWSLFIDPENHESVCKDHHDGLIQREEARGYKIGADLDGRPLDPHHPWNR